LCTLFIRQARVLRSNIVLKPSTLLHFHTVLSKRKYRILFSPKCRSRPGPKGPDKDLVAAVVAMKRRNPSWGCPRIAQQISLAFGVEIDKDVVRRLLNIHYQPESGSGGSFLAYISRPFEGQFVELRSVPLRIGHNENPLGSRGDGPIHPPHHRIWRSLRRR
jgi:hypothetical protein